MNALFTLLLLAPFVLSLDHISTRNSTGCPAWYNHDTHYCASNSYGEHLCEIVDGRPYLLCGYDQCYNDLQYHCNGLTLSVPPKENGTFFLQVDAMGKDYNLEFIQASDNQFWVGGEPTKYCPFESGCGTYEANTVFYTAHYLAVEVPGSQTIYIKKDGTLAFTYAHSGWEPDVAYDGENVAYVDAGYFGPDGHHWAACKPRGSEGRRRIVADLPETDLETEDCDIVFLYVNDSVPDGALGAFQYD